MKSAKKTMKFKHRNKFIIIIIPQACSFFDMVSGSPSVRVPELPHFGDGHDGAGAVQRVRQALPGQAGQGAGNEIAKARSGKRKNEEKKHWSSSNVQLMSLPNMKSAEKLMKVQHILLE